MRRWYRHPTDIPIEVRPESSGTTEPVPMCDLGFGGLRCRARDELLPGTRVAVRLPTVRPVFETHAEVVWCRPGNPRNGFEVGMRFLDADEALRTRIVEQVCHIEHYRRFVREREGRELSAEEAALEWIGKYSPVFPAPGDDPGEGSAS